MKLHLKNKTVRVSDDGFLLDREEWDLDVAQKLAENLGMERLSDEQLDIITFLRDYYAKYSAFPILNYVCKHVDQPGGCLNDEFVNPMNAWKIAGLPQLDGIHFVSVYGKNYQLEECC